MLNLENIKREYDEILNQLSSPELISDWEKFEELSKKKRHLEKIMEKQKEIDQIKKEMEENKSILSSGEDSELAELAEGELKTLIIKQENLEKELEEMSKEKEEAIPRAVIVEIRAGTGGEEAALFAADLFKMYSKYAQLQGWKQKVLDSNPTGIGGFKEVIFELKSAGAGGGNVFSKMKWEGGVHRVQRIPATEKSGRVHTSTASVAVLPKPQKTEFIIKPSDLKTDVYKSSGPGGQYVNKRETAVRITHLPTGLVVTSQTERNLLQNKENALAILEARLLEKRETESEEKMGDKRRTQIGQAKRA
ncbi:MAG: peptide chain release factor 1, partial [Candidatus Nealsonbacteria bacterium RIFCSPLOWO2_01_FULL_41_9]